MSSLGPNAKGLKVSRAVLGVRKSASALEVSCRQWGPSGVRAPTHRSTHTRRVKMAALAGKSQ